ncbi:hypothetical protein [Kocuria sp. CPCC 205263]|uniref:hypothetical protein n=1 Tax=Kocuria sp. CPCC 205263 TaxID=3073555 RepID=UPI0034D43797
MSHNDPDPLNKDRPSKNRIIEGVISGTVSDLLAKSIGAAVVIVLALLGVPPLIDYIRTEVGPTPPPPTAAPSDKPVSPNSEPPTVIAEPPPPPLPPTLKSSPTPTLASIRVSISEPRNVIYGEKVGPNRFKRDDQHGKVIVSYTWQAIRSNGTVNENLECAIHAEVAGPQWVAAMEADECTFEDEGSISFSDDNVQEYTEPGDYVVTVTDQLTGATGTATFTVV